MSDIFISYSREEQAIARQLADALQALGWSVWWDPQLQAGEDFEDAIEVALEGARCVIVLWSSLSVKSAFVKDEARYARDHNKLVPVAIEDVVLPFRFRSLQTATLTGWDGNRDASMFRSLAGDIAAVVGHGPVAAENESDSSDSVATRYEKRQSNNVSESPVEKNKRAERNGFSAPPKWATAAIAGVFVVVAGWYAWDQARTRTATEVLIESWESDGLPFCNTFIGGRYPVDRAAAIDIKMDDFEAFFGPGGKVALFVDAIRSADTPTPLSSDAATQFEHAKTIRNVYFEDAGQLRVIEFNLVPRKMDASINQFSLDLEGRRIEYRHGPRIPKTMEWPGPGWPGTVRLDIDPRIEQSTRSESGPWAWLRTLDAAQVMPSGQPGDFEVKFKLGGRSVTYELKTLSRYDPFRLPELEAFRCPEQIFD